MAQKVIEFDDVTFRYGKHLALDKISFSIKRKDFVAIIGPNGGGKTTLIKLIFGFLKPAKGSIKVFGKENPRGDMKKIGYLSQNATSFDHNFPASAYEVASMGRFAKKGVMKQLSKNDHAIIEKSLKAVNMLEMCDKKIGDLSGGQQQRIFIARALAAEPEILILDEPLSGVDLDHQQKFYDLLKDLNKKLGLTIVIILHDVKIISKSLTKLICVNVNITVHDVTKGIKDEYLVCAYPAGVDFVRKNIENR